MAIDCPHCASTANKRTSRKVSVKLRENYYACSNIFCGWTGKAYEEVALTLSPSAMPSPGLYIPLSPKKQAPTDGSQMELAIT